MKTRFISAALVSSLVIAATALARPGPDGVTDQAVEQIHQHANTQVAQTRHSQSRDTRRSQQNPRYDWRHYNPGHRPPDYQRHRNFDRRAWEHNRQASRRYRWNRYQQPHGWNYQRWTFGMILPSLFWTRQYWIGNYYQFGLANPPYGYVWVRYGNDALLVSVANGHILQVVYGLFY